MKRKIRIKIIPMMVGVLMMITSSCKKDDINPTNGRTTAIFNPNKIYGTLSDIDGNVYKTISIGTQTWMAENLRTTRYRNGDSIHNATKLTRQELMIMEAFANYNNTDNNDSIATFGNLYNGFAIMDKRNIAPVGWHVPTDSEWTTLTTYLGGEIVAGGKLKETGTTHWVTPNTGATNESGFTALPGGYGMSGFLSFELIAEDVYWWSVTPNSQFSNVNYYRCIHNRYSEVNTGYTSSSTGFSVRCVKD